MLDNILALSENIIAGLLLLCSVIATSIIIERIYILFKRHRLLDVKHFSVIDVAPNSILSQMRSPVVQLVISARNLPDNEPGNRLAVLAQCKVKSLERFMRTLSTLATVAPLLGLLGTVTGMIKAFKAFVDETNMGGSLMLGVDEALLTTAYGLCVAIPSLIAYNYFSGRISALVQQIETCLPIILESERALDRNHESKIRIKKAH